MDALQELDTFEAEGKRAWGEYEKGREQGKKALWMVLLGPKAPHIIVTVDHPDPEVLKRLQGFMGGQIVKSVLILEGREARVLTYFGEHALRPHLRRVSSLLALWQQPWVLRARQRNDGD
jgi:hypothetical protein